jgi:Ribbon-helix-helix domain
MIVELERSESQNRSRLEVANTFRLNCHWAEFVVPIEHYVVYTGAMKHRTNIYLTADQVKQLKALNEKTGAPVAELVRRAVDEYLKKRKRER